MNASRIIKGVVGGGRYTVTAPIIKEDYGLYLKIEGLELPATYEVDFSNDEHNGTSVTMIGNADGVLIPRQFISSGKDVFAFLYHVGADFGRTVYKFRIPNKLRPDRTNEQPTPEEQSTIDQAISALNTAVEQTAQDVIDADASAQSASQSAENAHDSAVDAQNYAESAQTYANNASASASQASASATASAQSASDAETARQATTSLVAEAQGYANASAQSAQASAQSASQAHQFAQTASLEAESAQDYATQADISANTASNKAQEASTSAQTASTKATESANSASQALTYKNDAKSAKTASQTAQGKAEDAQTAAETAQGKAEDAQEAAETVAASIQSSASQIAQNTADIADLQTDVAQNEADILKAFPTDSASGAIASFSDGANDLPLKSLVVDINPVQDLHGYDSPWPAGGGEQLIPYPYSQTGTTTINGITFDVIADGDIAISGTASANAQIDLCTNNYNTMLKLPAGDYTISVNNTNVRAIVTIYDGDGHSTAEYGTPASRVFNIPNDGSDYRCRVLLRVLNSTAISGTAHIAIKLQNGSLATAWSPYENICPISGWTEVDVEQSGVNLFDYDPSKATSGITEKGVMRAYYPLGLSNCTLSFSAELIDSGSVTASNIYIGKLKDGKLSAINNFILTSGITEGTFTFSENEQAVLMTASSSVDSIPNNFPKYRICVTTGSTPTPYEPYTGRSITIDLGQTVYGGKLNVLSGVLTIDRAMVDLGALNWAAYSAGVNTYRTQIATKAFGDLNLICSAYKTEASAFANMTNGTIRGTTGNTYVYVRDNNYTDVTSFKSAMTGQTLVYELAEPIEIQLSANQLNSLYGVNNIWADSGDTEVEYRADTKAWIQRKIAEAIASLT